MSYILRIDSSPRLEGSHSRRIANAIESGLRRANPDLLVRRRDLAAVNIPHITNEAVTGFYTPDDQMTPELRAATALSDELIAELKGAEVLLISTPMYNFGVPSTLKAWIDQIVRINQTFAFDGAAFTGLVPVRKAFLALAYGASGYTDGAPFSPMNFLEPYLVSLMGFLGIADTQVFRLEGAAGPEPMLIAQSHDAIADDITQSMAMAGA